MARTHEDFEEHVALRTASDRSFGLWVGGILAAIGLIRLLLHLPAVGILAPLMIVVGLVLVALGLTAAHLLAPLNRAWTKLGLVMFKVVSPVVLGVIFFGIFTPVGWTLRLLGRDAMARRFDLGARTYWIRRDPPGPPDDSFTDPF